MGQYKRTVYVCVGWVTVSFAMRCQWAVRRSDLGSVREREGERERRGREREKEGEGWVDIIAEGWC
jgi:hypothetical protein